MRRYFLFEMPNNKCVLTLPFKDTHDIINNECFIPLMHTQECWEKASNSKSFSTSSTSTDNNIVSALEAKKDFNGKVSPVIDKIKKLIVTLIFLVEQYFNTRGVCDKIGTSDILNKLHNSFNYRENEIRFVCNDPSPSLIDESISELLTFFKSQKHRF